MNLDQLFNKYETFVNFNLQKFKLLCLKYHVDKLSYEMISDLRVGSFSIKSVCSIKTLSDGALELKPFDYRNLRPLLDAIRNSKLELLPEYKGKFIYVPLPKLTLARRKIVVCLLLISLERFKNVLRNTKRNVLLEIKIIKCLEDVKRVYSKRVNLLFEAAILDLERCFNQRKRFLLDLV